jgi:hypothetical protein
MNAKVTKVSRRQDEDETLSNSRFKRLLLFLVLAQASSAIHSSTLFFQTIFKNFEAFHHVVRVKISFVSQHHQIRSFAFEYAEDRSRQEEEFEVLSTLSQIFDDEVCS